MMDKLKNIEEKFKEMLFDLEDSLGKDPILQEDLKDFTLKIYLLTESQSFYNRPFRILTNIF